MLEKTGSKQAPCWKNRSHPHLHEAAVVLLQNGVLGGQVQRPAEAGQGTLNTTAACPAAWRQLSEAASPKQTCPAPLAGQRALEARLNSSSPTAAPAPQPQACWPINYPVTRLTTCATARTGSTTRQSRGCSPQCCTCPGPRPRLRHTKRTVADVGKLRAGRPANQTVADVRHS